ncbi:unnamed protein product [Phyllotreta striolata]|uniref:Zinc finger-containing ubiquitin peptidase 1 n=1 Tax=Phyllotreta striolata TaxID=444603 RepID=A0A9N9TUT0_PHYSR|nr:unnamed protein product [Phyllotreta striolata]
MASNADFSHSCEICGLEGLTEDEFRVHTRTVHVEGSGYCPFCGLSTVSSSELILHVNQAHLDFLTPESEHNIGFIDDPSPSEFNGLNGENRWKCDDYQSRHSSLYQEGTIKSNININKNSKVNGGGELSPNVSGHGRGSPLRSNLELKLKNSQTNYQCPMCNYSNSNPNVLEEHVNRSHFDLISPSVGDNSATTATSANVTGSESYVCPLCAKSSDSASDLELHVNIEHRDILSPASSTTQSCPICGVALDGDVNSEKAAGHVESHFPAGSPARPPQPAERAALKERERREFEMLRAQYGMDNQGNFKEQSVTNMQRAVYAGEMSVSDYYERTLDLRASESCGVDDGTSVTKSMVPRLKALSGNSNQTKTLLCTCVDHYASSYGDRGWGCGYRNAQMLISSLLNHTGYNEKLYAIWKEQKPPRNSVPSISRVQGLIERAWARGFDLQGAEQLGSRLANTRKWIGATEVVTLLSSLWIKCQLVDFHKPTGAAGTHPELFNWVRRYFESSVDGEFTPPLYLQHQGHSRTIMGIEIPKDGNCSLLVLDPSHSPQQMAKLGDSNSYSSMRLLRKNEASMKARQYQIVAVIGMIENEQQYQQNKILRGLRIPQDR